ncbi:type IV pilus assembly protein PilM [Patescibacteria group bacterium]|nr:type IV pilus assembly protein PilM [Candidatus Falkowbacteria bacterium]MBU3906520.1 type IV pilus assembly protein PilM [Patescibacteria group bacterium]MBU4014914.1 type IV pilus assembly protein PilM [Patescibacteria group bacterium]MBU4026933.1 type IV pilus assembly protein PilM [Patescibacteria group bacterium]MBU4073659.1 type IV pilus assembly protein PilM [Patescibacteria group bacterium]
MGLLFPSKSYLGIDVGTSSVKIVELKKEAGKVKLLTYGFSEELQISPQSDPMQAADIINKICQKAGTISKSAVAALPTFSVFSSIINLAGVNKKDIASAVQWEAKKVIPLPLEDIILDWRKIQEDEEEKPAGKSAAQNMKVLLTGAPKLLVKKYIEIFKQARINLLSLETETFSLIRSLLGNDKSAVMIVEIGANTTDISIVNKSIPILTRSIDIGGLTITKSISSNLNIGLERAEQFKYDMGISSMDSQQDIIPQTIIGTISPIINEIKYTLNLFQEKKNGSVEKIILSGGAALLTNLSNYLSKILDINVIVGNPWSRVSCPLDLKPLLDEIGPRMSIAVGLAMREIE